MQVVWAVDNLAQIGGNRTEVLGSPNVIETPNGKAVEFDGKGDGLIVDSHPLSGVDRFTIEIVFRPDAGGLPEQRFLHLQDSDSEDRILIETRLIEDRQWFLDTYVQSNEASATLFAEDFRHPVGKWYHAALVYDGREMRHYVNGMVEMAQELVFTPVRGGQTSIGVRMNKVYWFRGAIKTVRFTSEALPPETFLCHG